MYIGVGRPGIRFRGVFCTGAATTAEVSEIAAKMAVSFIVSFGAISMLFSVTGLFFKWLVCLPEIRYIYQLKVRICGRWQWNSVSRVLCEVQVILTLVQSKQSAGR